MIDRTSLKLCFTGLALTLAGPLWAQPVLVEPSEPVASDLSQTVSASGARVRKLEYEVVSSQQALDEAKSAKPADRESVECAKEANAMAKANLAAAKKQLAADQAALAKAEKASDRGSTRLASGKR